MKIVAFKTGKPRPFNYRPIFYDQKKEEMEELMKRYKEPEEAENERFKAKIRGSWRRKESETKKMSNRTFYIYIIIALALLYYIFLK
ncbi:MAG: hypothetical protein K0B15_00765 [Lentimicrobium sp.]|nr:hypothetical protein [Lentimicrobium sp.]